MTHDPLRCWVIQAELEAADVVVPSLGTTRYLSRPGGSTMTTRLKQYEGPHWTWAPSVLTIVFKARKHAEKVLHQVRAAPVVAALTIEIVEKDLVAWEAAVKLLARGGDDA